MNDKSPIETSTKYIEFSNFLLNQINDFHIDIIGNHNHGLQFFEAYIDGSYKIQKMQSGRIGQIENIPVMGFGIVFIVNYNLIELQQYIFNGNTKGITSSTRAELTAFAVLTDIISQDLKLIINTDSQALITVMENYEYPKVRKRRKNSKIPIYYKQLMK